jgi:hypothetical protein
MKFYTDEFHCNVSAFYNFGLRRTKVVDGLLEDRHEIIRHYFMPTALFTSLMVFGIIKKVTEMNTTISLYRHFPTSTQHLHKVHSMNIRLGFRIYLSAYYLSVYGSTTLVDLDRFSSFLICTQSIGLLGRGVSPWQGHYLHTEQHKHRINAHIYPCLEWDSNPRSQF